MVSSTMQTITVDRVSQSGNAIAQQQYAGKTIHVPAGEVGETYDVRLTDKGGYFVAQLVDHAGEVQPPQPSIGPDTSEVGKDLLEPERNRSHSFKIRSSPNEGKLRSIPNSSSGRDQRSWISRRKL